MSGGFIEVMMPLLEFMKNVDIKYLRVYKNLVNYGDVLYDQIIMCKWKSMPN